MPISNHQLIPAIAAIIVFIVTAIFCFHHFNPALDSSFAWLAFGVCAFTLAFVAIVKFALGSLGSTTATTTASDDAAVRQRLAPMVIGIGTAGIVVIALVVITAISRKDDKGQAVLSIFTTILPVFATWVGAVIAFYFSNESFRIAAQAAGAPGMSGDNDPITGPGRFIAYEKITKIVVPSTESHAQADQLEMEGVRKNFSDSITRLIIFDDKKRVVYIIRKKLDDGKAATVADYLRLARNAADAINFRMLPSSATVADGIRSLSLYKTLDIFISDTGRSDDPVLGWVTDDKLI